MRIVGTALIALALVAGGCSGEGQEGSAEAEETVEIDPVENIANLEKLLVEQTGDDLAKITAKNLVLAYDKYATENPDDAQSPEMLLKAADIQNSDYLRWYDKAAETYKRIYETYPNHEKKTFAMFMYAMVNDFSLENKEEAKRAYNELIELFPDDEWSEQARQRLPTVDMTDEEFIEMAKEKNKEAS